MKGLWHTDENAQIDKFISGFTKKKKRPVYVPASKPALAPVVPVPVNTNTTSSSKAATAATPPPRAEEAEGQKSITVEQVNAHQPLPENSWTPTTSLDLPDIHSDSPLT